jgi:phosphoenolpyruvate carboxykinase (ATP)
VFENVMVDFDGRVDFLDETLSANGRGIVQWSDMGRFKSETVNTPPLDELDGIIFAINTRRHDVVPIVSRLSIPQLAAYFALGESIRTAADDPTKVGESVRVVGTDPFIVGDLADHVNRFHGLLRGLDPAKVQGYLLNTGGSGERFEGKGNARRRVQAATRVEIPEMATIIRNIARGTLEWQTEPRFGTRVPKKVPGIDLGRLAPEKFYSEDEIDTLVKKLRRERIEYLEAMEGLAPEIVEAVKEE